MRTFNERLVLRLSSLILFFLISLLIVYFGVAYIRGEIDHLGLKYGLILIGIYSVISTSMFWIGNKGLVSISVKDAVLVVVISWLAMVVIGSTPYYIYHSNFFDSIFESASGFTTTGSSIFKEVESLPKTLILWRSITQWIGGMGIILFFVSLIPSLGFAGKSLFSYEVPGPIKETMTPQIKDTARILWSVYLGLTILMVVILKLQGVNWFDSVNHAFTTLSTGGFSTKNDSLVSFAPGIQWTVVVFMILGGTNFGIYRLLYARNWSGFLKDVELKWYLSFILILILIFTVFTFFSNPEISLLDNLRNNAFTIVSLVTTTGFMNVDYEYFPIILQAILILTLITGGSAGSTSGGIKFYRIVLLYRSLSEQIKHSLNSNLVSFVRVGDVVLKQEVVFSTFVFFCVYLISILLGAIFFTATGLDFFTAFSASATFIGNVGPGFSTIGPTENFSHFSNSSKLVGAFLMILGRLEFFTILTLFHRSFWKEN